MQTKVLSCLHEVEKSWFPLSVVKWARLWRILPIFAGVACTQESPSIGIADATSVSNSNGFDASDGLTSLRDAGADLSQGANVGDAQELEAATDVLDAFALDASAPPDSTVLTSAVLGGDVLLEVIDYMSGPLHIHGLICRPNQGSGPFPAVVWNHGGASGVGQIELTTGGYCYKFAKAGYAVFESSYRGEDGSDGQIETCKGEADDVVALIQVLKSKPYVDPYRVAMTGGSHGGCITLRALEKGAVVNAATAFFPGTSIAGLIYFYRDRLAEATLAGNQAKINDYQARLSGFLSLCGGKYPNECPTPEVYKEHEPDPQVIGGLSTPLMIVHGLQDELINYADSCQFVSQTAGFQSYRVDNLTSILSQIPAGCALPNVVLNPTPLPTPTWPANRYFLLYDDLTHGANVEQTGALGVGLQFLLSRL